jgi:hypothetical protein
MGTFRRNPYNKCMTLPRRLFALSLPFLLMPLLLAACASEPPPPPRAAAWLGNQSGRVFVRVLAVEPVEAMELTAPDGRVFAPEALRAEQRPRGSDESWRPGIGLGGSVGSGSGSDIGIGISLPMGNPFAREAPRGAIASEAQFVLPAEALASYRSRPQDWRLDLLFPGRSTGIQAPPLAP